jgi:hypothetical protein
VRTIRVEVHPLGGDSFNIRLQHTAVLTYGTTAEDVNRS